MAPSQLKRLKASLREQGIIGPQKSKKQKRKISQDKQNGMDKRLQRSVALEGIRDQFNPFQFKTNARGPKFEATSLRAATAKVGARLGRPGASKAAGEEKRKRTLLAEMHSRNKAGGIRDRRFAEDDPTMTPEEKMLQRFAREQQSSHRKASIFDLEDGGLEEPLTHMGRALDLVDGDKALVDDFDERDLPSDTDSAASHEEGSRLKRSRIELNESAGRHDLTVPDGPEKIKSRQEVMQEVIAKSKLHKHERQAVKEDDDDLRREIDQEMPQLQALLAGQRVGRAASDNKAALSHLAGYDKTEFERAYDLRVKQLAQDKRAQPSERTKTEEEVAELESQRLKELEEKRAKRMAGEDVSDIDDSEEAGSVPMQAGDGSGINRGDSVLRDNEAQERDFGLGQGIDVQSLSAPQPQFEDEDDFIIDDDLVASESEIEEDDEEDDDDDDEDSEDARHEGPVSDEDEFTKGLLTEPEERSGVFTANDEEWTGDAAGAAELPYTFPCPQSHAELLSVFDGIPLSKLSQIIQRIRALYHPSLAADNKPKLAVFARILVQHIAYLGNEMDICAQSSATLEDLMRHVHSLAKGFPIEISLEFREQIVDMGKTRPLALTVGDLAILTAVRLYPTSDHFHLVVTPAMLSIARYLGQKVPRVLSDYATGTYLSLLALDYQRLSARYIPELLNFSLNTLCALAPQQLPQGNRTFPIHENGSSTRIRAAGSVGVRRLSFGDCRPSLDMDENSSLAVKVALASTTLAVLAAAASLWSTKPAFTESFAPVLQVLAHLNSERCRSHLPPGLHESIRQTTAKLQRMVVAARLSRRPLELHHHRPIAIKTLVPKFEDGFDPNKHYDADRDKAHSAKLRVEHKRERKGAIRELRKDAAFVARENLRVKKERDVAYEKKYKRLVAEIQGDEGHEANMYEREKSARKKAKRR